MVKALAGSKERLVPVTDDKLTVQAAINSWRLVLERASKTLSNLPDDQLLKEVAPGRNRLIYLWGHLTAIHDAMFPILGLAGCGKTRFEASAVPQNSLVSTTQPDKKKVCVDKTSSSWMCSAT